MGGGEKRGAGAPSRNNVFGIVLPRLNLRTESPGLRHRDGGDCKDECISLWWPGGTSIGQF